LESGFLIASPQMRDPNFERSVVLLLQHSSSGALGLIINRESPIRLRDVAEQLWPADPRPESAGPDAGALPTAGARPALWGGPVERQTGFVIYRGSDPDAPWSCPAGIAVSTSRERLGELLKSGEEFHLCLGYSGWGPGQLDAEVESGSWAYVEADADLAMACPLAERYDRALARLGVAAGMLWMSPINE
jgi:putative transcriptional regulator